MTYGRIRTWGCGISVRHFIGVFSYLNRASRLDELVLRIIEVTRWIYVTCKISRAAEFTETMESLFMQNDLGELHVKVYTIELKGRMQIVTDPELSLTSGPPHIAPGSSRFYQQSYRNNRLKADAPHRIAVCYPYNRR